MDLSASIISQNSKFDYSPGGSSSRCGLRVSFSMGPCSVVVVLWTWSGALPSRCACARRLAAPLGVVPACGRRGNGVAVVVCGGTGRWEVGGVSMLRICVGPSSLPCDMGGIFRLRRWAGCLFLARQGCGPCGWSRSSWRGAGGLLASMGSSWPSLWSSRVRGWFRLPFVFVLERGEVGCSRP